MLAGLPPDLEAFIHAEVTAGTFASEQEAMTAAVRLLQERVQHLACLQSEIDEGLEAFENGQILTVKSGEERQALIDDICRRGRDRLNASRGKS